MEKSKSELVTYINELEEKIIDISLQLNNKTKELNLINESNRKSTGKLIHNLKNPIGVVFSFSDMILEDIEDYSTDKLEKHLQIIKKSANFSIQLLNSVAKYIQLKSHDYAYTFKSVDYTQLVNGVIREFDSIIVEKNIKIEQNLPKTPIILKLDESEISLVLRNIINNAFRYSNENTTIKITIRENLNTVETTITDEGIGISEENMPFIFNDFFVVNTYSEDKQKCIGLGLLIANKIVKEHKGKISATSIINKGTSFKIIFPKK